MNNLLVGNGINIQFNKTDYTTQQIVLRILKNCDRDDFPSHIIVNFPYLLKNYIGQLFLEARDILEDKYDNFTNCTAEDESLKSFKKQYADKIDTLRITDIGFEDYYLIHDLVCHKDFMKWVTVSNMFAKSRIMPMVALKQFNSLEANQRTNIKKTFEEYDQKRRIKIPKGEIDSAWTISVMVDAHIIATENNVDPLTVIMCLNPPCKINERIVIK